MRRIWRVDGRDRRAALAVCLSAVGLIVPLLAAAYDRPLSPHAIREGYFLGRRRDETTAKFLAQYVRRLPLPKKGPHVAEIEFRTPYQQVVLRARMAPNGYSSQQATQDYRARQDLILVRVQLNLTPTYLANSPDFWRDFSFRLIQEKPLPQKRIRGKPIYSGGSMSGNFLVGADVEVEFDANLIDSRATRVEVLTPDGQRVAVEFDLAKLR